MLSRNAGIRRTPVTVAVQKNMRMVARPRLVAPVRAISTPDWMEVSYFVGKSVILFTMFYSGLNWLHYRELRKREEEDNKNKK